MWNAISVSLWLDIRELYSTFIKSHNYKVINVLSKTIIRLPVTELSSQFSLEVSNIIKTAYGQTILSPCS